MGGVSVEGPGGKEKGKKRGRAANTSLRLDLTPERGGGRGKLNMEMERSVYEICC